MFFLLFTESVLVVFGLVFWTSFISVALFLTYVCLGLYSVCFVWRIFILEKFTIVC